MSFYNDTNRFTTISDDGNSIINIADGSAKYPNAVRSRLNQSTDMTDSQKQLLSTKR